MISKQAPNYRALASLAQVLLLLASTASSLVPSNPQKIQGLHQAALSEDVSSASAASVESSSNSVFFDFVEFLKARQTSIIQQVEKMDGSRSSFTRDTWGVFDDDFNGTSLSGGITRVIQGGNMVEKGACSLTLIRRGILSAERAAAIRSRQDLDIQAGDVYSAAALSIVLHSRSPMVPTFRSDVRIFYVESEGGTMAWFGGGADLTPYYLFDEDVTFFHNMVSHLDRSTAFEITESLFISNT